MSWFGDLLSFGGSYLGDREATAANNRLANIQQGQSDFEKKAIASGQVDPYGNVINRQDPMTGAFTTTLSPTSQDLANTQLENTLAAEKNRGLFGELAGDLSGQFRGTSIRDPLSRSEAQGIIDKDNQRQFNAVIDPITDKLASQAMRRFGNTSNLADFTTQATQQILPGIQIGGEREALALSDADMDRFIKNTLGLGGQLNQMGGAANVQLPGVASQGEVANSINAIGTPSVVPQSSSSALFNAVSRLGGQLNANEAQAQSTADRNRLISLLERQLGNQGVRQ